MPGGMGSPGAVTTHSARSMRFMGQLLTRLDLTGRFLPSRRAPGEGSGRRYEAGWQVPARQVPARPDVLTVRKARAHCVVVRRPWPDTAMQRAHPRVSAAVPVPLTAEGWVMA